MKEKKNNKKHILLNTFPKLRSENFKASPRNDPGIFHHLEQNLDQERTMKGTFAEFVLKSTPIHIYYYL